MNLDKIHGDDLLAEAQFPQLPTEEQRYLFLACICSVVTVFWMFFSTQEWTHW
jgi:hypothetical protein